MGISIKLISLLPFILLSTGCVSYSWIKPGYGDNDRQKQQTICQSEAIQRLPPEMVPIEERSTVAANEDCTKHQNHHKRMQCEQRQQSTIVRYDDINDGSREIIFNACMYRNGWTKTPVQN